MNITLIDYNEYGNYTNIFQGNNRTYNFKRYLKLLNYIHKLSFNINNTINMLLRLSDTNNSNLKRTDGICILEKFSIGNSVLTSSFKSYKYAYYIPVEIEFINYKVAHTFDATFAFDESLEKVLKESREIPIDVDNCKNLHIHDVPYTTINGKAYKKIKIDNKFISSHMIYYVDDVYIEYIVPLFPRDVDLIFLCNDYKTYYNGVYKDDNEFIHSQF
jgi:hypothetical protein